MSRAQAFSLGCAAIGGGGGGAGGVGVISGVGVVGGGGARQLFVVSAFRCVSHVAIFTLCLSARFSADERCAPSSACCCASAVLVACSLSAYSLMTRSRGHRTRRTLASRRPFWELQVAFTAYGCLHRLQLPSSLAAAITACSCLHRSQLHLLLPSPLKRLFRLVREKHAVLRAESAADCR